MHSTYLTEYLQDAKHSTADFSGPISPNSYVFHTPNQRTRAAAHHRVRSQFLHRPNLTISMRGFPLRFDPPHNQHRLDLLSFLKFLPHGRPVPTIQFFNLLPNRLLVDSFAELHFADARDLLGGQVLLKTELLLPYLSQILD